MLTFQGYCLSCKLLFFICLQFRDSNFQGHLSVVICNTNFGMAPSTKHYTDNTYSTNSPWSTKTCFLIQRSGEATYHFVVRAVCRITSGRSVGKIIIIILSFRVGTSKNKKYRSWMSHMKTNASLYSLIQRY